VWSRHGFVCPIARCPRAARVNETAYQQPAAPQATAVLLNSLFACANAGV
jgi:hypothetical protein